MPSAAIVFWKPKFLAFFSVVSPTQKHLTVLLILSWFRNFTALALVKIIPSAGQGIIALQCREDDEEIISVLKKINHKETFIRAHVERNILKVLEGDCETAVGAHSIIKDDKIIVEAELFSLDGSKRYYEKKNGKVKDFSQIGKEVGQILKTKSNNSYKR